MTQTISYREVKRLVDSKGKSKYALIDVRREDEMQYGMIPTAVNIPMSELMEAFSLSDEEFNDQYGIKKPHKKDNLIFYCRTGRRSQKVTDEFVNRGYKAKNFLGSVLEWSEHDPNVKMY